MDKRETDNITVDKGIFLKGVDKEIRPQIIVQYDKRIMDTFLV